MKLHEEANIEINNYGNDLSDIEKFATVLLICLVLLTITWICRVYSFVL